MPSFIQKIGKKVFILAVLLTIAFSILGKVVNIHFLWPLTGLVPLSALGFWDLFQKKHSLLRNYPVMGHMRFLLEGMGPELHQYIVEDNTEGKPFSRDHRSLIYQRAKDIEDKKPFGTELDVYLEEYFWINHSMAPKKKISDPEKKLRIQVGGPQCEKPYSASIFNISAMSFGSLSANAIRALNLGARMGGFAHDTGEGSISRYHREHGGDLIWEIGSGYFGCRHNDGTFNTEMFAEQAQENQVKMVEIKISQGAKPGHGGVLPGAKVTAEIAEARRVPVGVDCISPPYHSAFNTPIGLLEFIVKLRELCGGKPVGFKFCVGQPHEFLGVCKAMIETQILPDFIVVDGAEGGTGAAPLELSDHVGTPLKDGLIFVQNALVGIGLRDKIRLGASGKLVTAANLAAAMALGADWANSARGFMMAAGCLQTQNCHRNTCPVGVATQDKVLQRGLVVSEKAKRVHNFHRNTVDSLAELIAAAGLDHPKDLHPRHVITRIDNNQVKSYAKLYDWMEPGQLLEGKGKGWIQPHWEVASAKSFYLT